MSPSETNLTGVLPSGHTASTSRQNGDIQVQLGMLP